MLYSPLYSMLPVNERPEYTEKYEGFYHLTNINGTVENTTISYIIRDHSRELFEAKKRLLQETVDFLNKKYGDIITLELKDSYYNMKEMIEPKMFIIDLAKEAMENIGITPKIEPIRGGTDGARLSFMGLPCPNIFTGGFNFHGKYEYIPIQSMEKAVETILEIIRLSTEKF